MLRNVFLKKHSINPNYRFSWSIRENAGIVQIRSLSNYDRRTIGKNLTFPGKLDSRICDTSNIKRLFNTQSSFLSVFSRKKHFNNSTFGNLESSVLRFKTSLPDLNTLTGYTPEEGILHNVATNHTGKVKEVIYSYNRDILDIIKTFPSPKSIFHNYYQVVYAETNKNVNTNPSYKMVKDGKNSQWICSYHVFWPEEVKFLAKDVSKKEASLKASLVALSWLKKQGKMTPDGAPIIYDKEVVKSITRKRIPTFTLSSDTINNIRKLTDLYENDLQPTILAYKEDNDSGYDLSDTKSNPDDTDIETSTTRQFLDLEKYLAKEQVELPITKYKEEFIKLLRENRTIIVRGQPGCGKSTRIPQYVLEAWATEDASQGKPGLIAVTQPRRIAAISLAERVAKERQELVGQIVGYQVRLNSKFRSDTGRILYCTTGILLRHLQTDTDLSKYSHIILDEAHVRDVNTDLLMNLVKGALKKNSDLKLIVMSATMDTDMFSKYFDNAAVMDVPGFTFPVKEHFLDDCKLDVSKTLAVCNGDSPAVVHEEVVDILEFIHNHKPEGAILCFLPGWEDINKVYKMIPAGGDLVVYCLHSRLQDADQWKIFSRPPPGVRKIILATNIAETSVTIDDVVYVVDTGIQKDLIFDFEKGINCMDNHWISKASARQRKGRAGRVQPGESFHLYTKAKHNSLEDYSLPEIQTTSLNKIVLDCKVFTNNMNALEFMSSLPTPPDESATFRAVNELTELELLDDDEHLTPLGRTIANFQLEPKLSKAMINAVIFKCITPIVDIITLYSSETEFFVSGLLDKGAVKDNKECFCKSSDHLAMMKLFEKWLEYKEKNDTIGMRSFCNQVNVIPHKMNFVEKLRKIHFDYLYKGLKNVLPIADDMSDNDELVKGVLFSGVGNVLQYRNWDIVNRKFKNNVNVLLTRNNHRATLTSESVNSKRKQYPSNFLMYINETRSNIRRTTLVRETSLIPNISVLLFSNKKLTINTPTEISSAITSDDPVELILEGTNIKFLCDRKDAELIMKLKDATMSIYQYYIKQLTSSGKLNTDFNNSWDNYLVTLGNLLDEHSIPS